MPTDKNKSPFSLEEEKIMKFWEENKIFDRSLEKNPADRSYVFYDGPPFATGLPHYGHLVAGTMKDVIPRYWTMKGYRVERKWGWDCHGLPIENLIEKELELKNKKDIEDMGIDRFNEACRSSVLRYAEEWKKTVGRMGRWVDMENDYKTMDPDYMESIWWVFKSLWDKGMIYEGHKPMHICPRCETTLSNFEVTQGYKDVKDISITAKFELVDEPGTFVLAWTTTPWTLPGNVALAVNPDIIYVKVLYNNEYLILAKDRLAEVFKDKQYELIDELESEQLIGKRYKPLFDYFDNDQTENRERAWKIYPADFVNIDEGTGIVHIAPAFGEDDMNLGKANDLPFIQHVGINGRFTEEVSDLAGMEVKPKDDPMSTDVQILKLLASKNKVFHKEKIEHSYPHCWRCDTPLLNYATSSWFVNVTDIKDKMIANNKKINWVPEHIKEGRFGKWLENAKDWAISRNRYWGAPLPVWKCPACGEIKVFGSMRELAEASGQEVKDLHKHIVDKIEVPCQCGAKMKRIPEVLDCWFESGSMPYAQKHYPFENKAWFEDNFPAQFIAEGLDQTRGWFYTLIVLSTALFDKPAFLNVIVNGIVLAEDGAKMSKRLKNYPDPTEVIDKYGADSLRFYLLNSPVMKAEDLRFSEKGVLDVLRNNVMILWNVFSLFNMYRSDLQFTNKVPDSDNVLDKWIIAKLHELIKEVTIQMDTYDLVRSTRPIETFISELSTWYIRRCRDRFKDGDKEALMTTQYVLAELSKVIAPFMPFIAERLFQGLADPEKSVHLEDWPAFNDALIDNKVLEDMDKARKIVEMGMALRKEAGIKVRQPLARLSTYEYKLSDELANIAASELNVKKITNEKISDASSKEDGGLKVSLDMALTDELKKEGIAREMVRAINQMRKNRELTIDDSVAVQYFTKEPFILEAINEYAEQIKKDTLSSDLTKNESAEESVIINGAEVWLSLSS